MERKGDTLSEELRAEYPYLEMTPITSVGDLAQAKCRLTDNSQGPCEYVQNGGKYELSPERHTWQVIELKTEIPMVCANCPIYKASIDKSELH
jgi:hypothetical protein